MSIPCNECQVISPPLVDKLKPHFSRIVPLIIICLFKCTGDWGRTEHWLLSVCLRYRRLGRTEHWLLSVCLSVPEIW